MKSYIYLKYWISLNSKLAYTTDTNISILVDSVVAKIGYSIQTACVRQQTATCSDQADQAVQVYTYDEGVFWTYTNLSYWVQIYNS